MEEVNLRNQEYYQKENECARLSEQYVDPGKDLDEADDGITEDQQMIDALKAERDRDFTTLRNSFAQSILFHTRVSLRHPKAI